MLAPDTEPTLWALTWPASLAAVPPLPLELDPLPLDARRRSAGMPDELRTARTPTRNARHNTAPADARAGRMQGIALASTAQASRTCH